MERARFRIKASFDQVMFIFQRCCQLSWTEVDAQHDKLGPDLQNILRQSYDNAEVMIDLRRSSNLQNILRRTQGFS